jgi:hypothetical protein
MRHMSQQKHANPTEIRLAAPLEFGAGDGDALPAKLSGVAYSGGAVRQYGCVIDLESTEVPAKMPLLFEHMRSEIVGVVDKAAVKAGQIVVEGKLFSDMTGSAAERIAQLSQRGAPYQMSVGLFGYSEEYVPLGAKTKVNGKDHAGPIVVLRNGKVRECSVVTLGADDKTDAQFFSMPEQTGKPATSEDTMTLEQLVAQVALLTAQVGTLTTERDAAKAELTASKEAAATAAKAERVTAVDALFSELGEKPNDDEKATFVAMGAAEFTATAARLRATVNKAKKLNPALFSEQAHSEQQGEQKDKGLKLSVGSIYASRAKAAAA